MENHIDNLWDFLFEINILSNVPVCHSGHYYLAEHILTALFDFLSLSRFIHAWGKCFIEELVSY